MMSIALIKKIHEKHKKTNPLGWRFHFDSDFHCQGRRPRSRRRCARGGERWRLFFFGGWFLTWEMMEIECWIFLKFIQIQVDSEVDKMIVFVFTDWFPFCLAFTLSVRFKKNGGERVDWLTGAPPIAGKPCSQQVMSCCVMRGISRCSCAGWWWEMTSTDLGDPMLKGILATSPQSYPPPGIRG